MEINNLLTDEEKLLLANSLSLTVDAIIEYLEIPEREPIEYLFFSTELEKIHNFVRKYNIPFN